MYCICDIINFYLFIVVFVIMVKFMFVVLLNIVVIESGKKKFDIEFFN